MKNRVNRFRDRGFKHKDRRQSNYGDRQAEFCDNYSHNDCHRFHPQAKSPFSPQVKGRKHRDRTRDWRSPRSDRFAFKSNRSCRQFENNRTGWQTR